MNPDILACTKNGAPHLYQFPWRNFTDLLKMRAAETPDQPALIFRDCDTDARQEITYAEFDRQTAALAGHLHRDYGIGPGDCVSLALPNCAEIPLLTLALFRLGATSVPLDLAKDVPERKRYKIENAHSRLLVVLPEHVERERKELPDTRMVTTQQLLQADGSDADLEPEWSGNETLEQGANVVLYTSGTTGHPKGVLLTRQSITANADGIIRWLGFDASERLNLVLPLHHVNSTIFSLVSLMVGGSLILNSRYSVSAFWRVVAQERATSASIVPTIMADLLARKEEADAHDISSLKKIMIGSAPVPANVAGEFFDHFGIRLVQGYGSTEVSLRVTGVPPTLPEDHYRDMLRKNSIGAELANNNIRIDGDPPEGEPGEILVRGPVTAKGYLNQEEATREVFKDGWFYSGDLGFYRDLYGHRFYFMHGRKKEILIKGGVNISPIAVENALRDAFPEILATYVVGIQHDRWGEEVCAAVIFQPFIEDQKRAADHIVETGQMGRIANLSTYEAPARIMAITAEDLPLTSTGKVQRSALRKKIQDRLNREGK
jgi:long-chain acyl-CoA synthetase